MKALVVFYSRTGNTEKIADEIAKKLKADADEIDSEDYSGVFGYISGILQVIFKRKPEIDFSKDPLKYDLIIIGSPIWGGTFTPPIRSYITQNKEILMKKKIAFFCSSGGGEIKRGISELKKIQPMFNALNVLEKEVKANSYKNKLNEFCDKIK